MFSMLKKWLRKNDHSKIGDKQLRQKYLDYCSLSHFSKSSKVEQAQLVAVDFETTGLNPKKDAIISMGFCPIIDDVIKLSQCLHVVVKTEQALEADNVAIHGLTDDALEMGVSYQQAIEIFMKMTAGKVVIAHYHGIEVNFTQALSKKVLGVQLPLMFVDTFKFAERQRLKANQPVVSGELRLFNLRKQIKLPNYKAHNALEDAISTAELFLAQKASLNMKRPDIQLRDMGFSKY